MVEVAGKGGSATDFGSAVQTEDDLTTDDDDEAMQDVQLEENRGRWEMEVARVYEKTLVELGVSLDTSGIGTFD